MAFGNPDLKAQDVKMVGGEIDHYHKWVAVNSQTSDRVNYKCSLCHEVRLHDHTWVDDPPLPGGALRKTCCECGRSVTVTMPSMVISPATRAPCSHSAVKKWDGEGFWRCMDCHVAVDIHHKALLPQPEMPEPYKWDPKKPFVLPKGSMGFEVEWSLDQTKPDAYGQSKSDLYDDPAGWTPPKPPPPKRLAPVDLGGPRVLELED